jgi:tartrate-resistant acid phosphatase type 5
LAASVYIADMNQTILPLHADPHGLKHSNDYLFDKSFKQIYTASELRSVPWHAVMGNHDYGDGYSKCDKNKGGSCKCGCEPQLWGNLAGRDGRWRGERGTTKEFGDGLVELFFIDTSPFIDSYQGQSWAYCQRGGIRQQSWDWQRKELRKSLKGSNARWKIAIGHHPLRSNGKHGDSRDLKNRLEPVLAENGVRAYFAGHDHNLEHVDASDRGIQVFVSGSGGDIGYFKGKSRSKFQDKGPGFAAVKIMQDRMEVRYYTVDKGASSPAYKTAMKYK